MTFFFHTRKVHFLLFALSFVFSTYYLHAQQVIPGRIEAEHFDSAHDTTPGNQGTAPRDGDVDLEQAQDLGGGLNVGWIDEGEYLRFLVHIRHAGEYLLRARVASDTDQGRLQVKLDGENLGERLAIPATGSWQTWIDLETRAYLPAGEHELEIFFEAGLFNLNYLDLISLVEYRSLPAFFEAESYDDYHDNSAGNIGTAAWHDDVDVEQTSDEGGGLNIGWIEPGEWLRYFVDAPESGTYLVSLRVATTQDSGALHLEANGEVISEVLAVPNTAGWQNWTTIEAEVELAAGRQALDLVFDGSEFNLNYFEVDLSGPSVTLPARIEAEDYVAFSDTTAGNEGGDYREDDVDIRARGAGYYVGWMDVGETLDYAVRVPQAGRFRIALAIATPYNGRRLQLQLNEQTLAESIDLPNTGGWNHFQTVQFETELPKGNHLLRLNCLTDLQNVDFIDIQAADDPPNDTWQLVWRDEFDGNQVDSSKWSFEVNGKGGGNNELQYYTDRRENCYVANGHLVIRADRERYTGPDGTRDYTSARLRTIGKGDWLYGRFEIRARLPRGQGMWPAIWMLPTDWVYGGWAASGEIDIMEAVNLGGTGGNKIHGTLHYGGSWPNNTHSGDHMTPTKDVSQEFHTYSVEWEPGEIRWYIDGQHYQTQTQWWSSNGDYPAPFDKRFHLILNVAVGGTWPGNPNGSTQFPQTMEVDFVRVYQKNR